MLQNTLRRGPQTKRTPARGCGHHATAVLRFWARAVTLSAKTTRFTPALRTFTSAAAAPRQVMRSFFWGGVALRDLVAQGGVAEVPFIEAPRAGQPVSKKKSTQTAAAVTARVYRRGPRFFLARGQA